MNVLWISLSGTGGRCCTRAGQTACEITSRHKFSVWNDVMAANLNVISKIGHSQSMHIYLKNNRAHFFPRSDLKRQSIRLFLKRSPQQEELNSKMSSDNFGLVFSFWSKKYAECIKRLGLHLWSHSTASSRRTIFKQSQSGCSSYSVHEWQIAEKTDAGFSRAKSAKIVRSDVTNKLRDNDATASWINDSDVHKATA